MRFGLSLAAFRHGEGHGGEAPISFMPDVTYKVHWDQTMKGTVMKKYLTMLLVLVMVVCSATMLVGCGNDEPTAEDAGRAIDRAAEDAAEEGG